MKYDTTEYEITVTVKDNGDGSLDVSASPNTLTFDFENEYTAEGDITFEGTKSLSGMTLEEGAFSFVLLDADENVIETVSNAEDGSFSFTTLTYDQSVLENEDGT